MRNDRDNMIIQMTFDFSESLRDSKKFEMASQLFRSGTSIVANAREAQNAESKKDFIHKFKLAAKADETEYWLEPCKNSKHYPSASEPLEKVISKRSY